MAGTGIAYPADAVSGSPDFAAIDGRNALAAAMGGATASRPLGGITGVRPGTPSNTITVTSTTWTMNPNGFGGYIDLETSATNSGYFFKFVGTINGSIVPAGGSARTDLVYVQINDSNTSDGSSGAPGVVLDYISNYPTNALPVRSFAVAQINVPATGGGSPTVTWIAPYTVAAGGIVPAISSTYYPSAASYPGQYLDDLSTGTLLRSNGTSWVTVNGSSGTFTPASGFSAVSTYTPKLSRSGSVVTVEFVLTNTSTVPTGTVSANNGTLIGTIPSGFRPVNPLVGLIGFNNSGAVAIKYTVDSSGNVKAYPDSSLGSGATLYCTGQFFAA